MKSAAHQGGCAYPIEEVIPSTATRGAPRKVKRRCGKDPVVMITYKVGQVIAESVVFCAHHRRGDPARTLAADEVVENPL